MGIFGSRDEVNAPMGVLKKWGYFLLGKVGWRCHWWWWWSVHFFVPFRGTFVGENDVSLSGAKSNYPTHFTCSDDKTEISR